MLISEEWFFVHASSPRTARTRALIAVRKGFKLTRQRPKFTFSFPFFRVRVCRFTWGLAAVIEESFDGNQD